MRRKVTVKRKDGRIHTTFKCVKEVATEWTKRYRALGYVVKVEVL